MSEEELKQEKKIAQEELKEQERSIAHEAVPRLG